ncbi:MAG: hypothetical protein ACK40L_14250, partial [Hydrogenophaga sp.]
MQARRWIGGLAVAAAAATTALTVRGPRRRVPLPAVHDVTPLLPDQDQLWGWIEALNAFGPRLTATAAHA